MLRRELFLSGVAAAGLTLSAFPVLAQSGPARPAPAKTSLREAAREAYIFTLPLIENAAARSRILTQVGPAGMRHVRALATPASRAVTTPNNDTIYSAGWVDLANGPVTLVVPPTGRRYASLALMDMYTNNFAILGTRTTGSDGGRFTLVGPLQATSDPAAIRAPTRWVWVLARVLVDGPEDLAAAHAVQNGFRVEGWKAPVAGLAAKRDAPWPEYFRSAEALMLENPPPATDEAILRRMAPLGLTRAGGFDPARFTPTQAAEIEAGVEEARRAVRLEGGSMQVVQGWSYPRPTLGDFGQDYLFRAQVALTGLAALTTQEATYMRSVAPDGGFVHSGGGAYRLHFPAGQTPPVAGFWSLTIYEPTDAGQFFLSPNPLNRYSIGDRTPGLKRNRDGSLDIWISHADPGAARRSNWLPAPEGPFGLFLRAYLPRSEFVDGRYRVPPLQRVS